MNSLKKERLDKKEF